MGVANLLTDNYSTGDRLYLRYPAAMMAKASPSDLCRSERPILEPRLAHQLFIKQMLSISVSSVRSLTLSMPLAHGVG